MADIADHLELANHNEKLARILINDPEWRDWVITLAFYAAVHVAEACFFVDPDIKHTEKKCSDGKFHDCRQDTIRLKAPLAYDEYKKLRTASWQLRYLGLRDNETLDKVRNYYSQEMAVDFVVNKLPQLRAKLGTAFGVDVSRPRPKKS